MLLGLALIIVGVTFVVRNRELSVSLGFDEPANRWGFLASTARQNFAVVGIVLALVGLASVLLL
jgi:hypothetical protein